MSGAWRALVEPPDLGDADANRSARTLHWLLLLTFATTCSITVATPLLRPTPLSSILIYVSCTGLALSCLLLLHRGRPRVAGAMFTMGMWTVGTAAMALYGPKTPAVTQYIVAILLAGFFWSRRAANGVAALSVLALIMLYVLDAEKLLPPPVVVSPIRSLISVSAVLTVTTVILRLSLLGIEAALGEARRSAAQARASQSALAESQRQLEEARRLEALGRLAGGVAHDFNNLLMVILANVHQAREEREDEPRDDLLAQVEDAGNRATALTAQLLAFGRGQILSPRPLDLARVVLGLEPLLRRVLGESIELDLVLDAELPPVCADPSQLEQVVLNLAANARDALAGGGQVTIQTCRFEESPHAASWHTEGPLVALIVTDDGPGMDEETRASVFEPFFTTKSLGRGTGLGLATVHGIVSQSEGQVWVESEPGRGSRFVVVLPGREASANSEFPEPVAPRHSPQPAPLSGRALLVEDNEAVRLVLRRMLERAGLDVLACSSPRAALEHDLDRVDLLVSDVVMPELMGTELAAALRRRRPTLPVLLVSGYPQPALEAAPSEDLTWFLRKPFSHEQLQETVRAALETRLPKAQAASDA